MKNAAANVITLNSTAAAEILSGSVRVFDRAMAWGWVSVNEAIIIRDGQAFLPVTFKGGEAVWLPLDAEAVEAITAAIAMEVIVD